MSRKIIIIENREGRQKEYLPNGKSDVDILREMSSFLKMNSYEEDLHKINENDLSFLQEFDLIIIHRSALGELPNGSAANRVVDFCKMNKLDLIFFSGGISSSSYSEEGGKFLLVNSKEFYSENLIPFLKRYHLGDVSNLIELKYGNQWRLAYLLQLREVLELMKCGEDNFVERESLIEILGITDIKNVNSEINALIDFI